MSLPTRDRAIEGLFEPFDVRAFASLSDPSLIAHLHDDEAAALAPMAQARQAEFATARACAHAALNDLGVSASIPRQDGGAPQWPEGMAGSISHTRGFCLAVASRDGATLGVDIEEIARMKPAVERRILIDAERAVVELLDDGERRQVVATIFAAKEAFYKAHYEVDPRYLGFDAVHVTVTDGQVDIGPGSGEVDPSVLQKTSARSRIDEGRVIVGVAINVSDTASPLPSPA